MSVVLFDTAKDSETYC